MFSKANSIDKAFRQMKFFAFTVVITCGLVSGFTLYLAAKRNAASEARIYILANGKALEAYQAERKDNVQIEARDHVKMFHHYFFTLDPDDKVIQDNIKKALYLSDATAKQQYDNLRENNYYSNIISGNISQTITTDSIEIDIGNYPYHFKFSGKQQIVRPTSITIRSLKTEGYIRSITRSDNNPHGFLIEKWRTIENSDIKTDGR